MEYNKAPRVSDYDEIELFELVKDVWAQKLLIIICTFLAALIGYVYTLAATEKWVAMVQISAPTLVQFDGLNPPTLCLFTQKLVIDESNSRLLSDRSPECKAVKVEPDDLFAAFLSELNSVRTLLRYDSAQPKSIFQSERDLTDEELIEAAKSFLGNNLKVTPPSKTSSYATVELIMDSPAKAVSFLGDYIGFVSSEVIDRQGEILQLAINRTIQTNEFAIEIARGKYVRRIQEDLALLEEALQIAKIAGIRENQSGLFVDRTDNRLTAASGLHHRGERLLTAEIQALKSRIDSAPLGLIARDLQAENELLRGITLDITDASAVDIRSPVNANSSRSSPKTKLIITLAVILGGIFGVLTASIRSVIKNR